MEDKFKSPKFKFLSFELPKLQAGFFSYLYVLSFLIIVSALSFLLVPWIGYRSIGFIFLFAVLVIGTISSFGPILFAAGLSAVIWNYFFIPPRFTFVIKEPEDVMNFFALFLVAFVAGYLASRIKRQEEDLSERAHRSSVLYEFSRRLADSTSMHQIAQRAIESIEQVFNFDSIVLMKKTKEVLSENIAHLAFDDFECLTKSNSTNLPGSSSSMNVSPLISSKDFEVASWSLQNQKRAGWGTDTLSSSKCLAIPLEGRSGIIGVLMIWPRNISVLTLEQENLIETFASNLAIGLERELFRVKAQETEILESSERLHQALLSSVSHELRTPLTVIIGNATALKDEKTSRIETGRDEIINDLIDSAERLNRVVENLLDMTRISSGTLKVNDELFEIGDFVDSTIKRSSSLVKNHRIQIDNLIEETYVIGDDRLLEHVIVNLLVNAASYSDQGSLIQIKIEKVDSNVKISVIDEGIGLVKDDLEKIFEQFYRSHGTPTGGTGLGLSIAKSIIEAHHGKITASQRTDKKGSVFSILLPVADSPFKKKGNP